MALRETARFDDPNEETLDRGHRAGSSTRRAHMTSTDIAGSDSAALIARWSEAAQLYIDGDLRGYAAIARHGEDYTLLPPHGGDARFGFDDSDDAVEWTARTFRGGQTELDVIKTYTSGDLAVLVAVERQSGAVGDLPSQDWSLRITLVFRREDAVWRLVHRHADPLVRPINPELLAAIARGEHSV
jgi:ketosteroid isomerase-like protein